MRWPVVFSYARLRPAMVRSFPGPKPSTTVQNNAAGSTCRSRFTAPVERASATRNTVGNSLRRASRIGTAFSRAIGCSSSLGKPEVRSMARPSSQKAAIVAQIVRAGSLNRTPMVDDCVSLKVDVDHYNAEHRDMEQIVMVFDMTDDVAEREAMRNDKDDEDNEEDDEASDGLRKKL